MTNFEKEYGPSPKKRSQVRLLLILVFVAVIGGGVVFFATSEEGSALSANVSKALTQVPVDTPTLEKPALPAHRAPSDAEPYPVEPSIVGLAPEDRHPGVLKTDSELEEIAARLSDLETQAWIYDAIRIQPRLANTRIRAEVENGAVSLSGAVSDADQEEAVMKIARAAAGDGEVTSTITVTEAPAPPEDLDRRVGYALYASRAFDLERIEISAEGGAVTLSGMVKTKAELLLAARLAAEVTGVVEVTNELQVDPDVP